MTVSEDGAPLAQGGPETVAGAPSSRSRWGLSHSCKGACGSP